ncbi:unnamed protein product [Sphenostylis stenocarpa]|uniref:Uncharacterized protein n=1 Tax=Sphenostylis stenocarpa TaxID=92480 RepID=A0AA86S6T6_9FABA|nr:unnamed protein product [Sphenostylis stenocarpa]
MENVDRGTKNKHRNDWALKSHCGSVTQNKEKEREKTIHTLAAMNFQKFMKKILSEIVVSLQAQMEFLNLIRKMDMHSSPRFVPMLQILVFSWNVSILEVLQIRGVGKG